MVRDSRSEWIYYFFHHVLSGKRTDVADRRRPVSRRLRLTWHLLVVLNLSPISGLELRRDVIPKLFRTRAEAVVVNPLARPMGFFQTLVTVCRCLHTMVTVTITCRPT